MLLGGSQNIYLPYSIVITKITILRESHITLICLILSLTKDAWTNSGFVLEIFNTELRAYASPSAWPSSTSLAQHWEVEDEFILMLISLIGMGSHSDEQLL